jgi:hypothetical protein
VMNSQRWTAASMTGCVQLALGGDVEGRSNSGRSDSCGGEETAKRDGA